MLESEHRHIWDVPSPSGSRVVTATCRGCGGYRVMYNSLQRGYGAWEHVWWEPGSKHHLGISMEGAGVRDWG